MDTPPKNRLALIRVAEDLHRIVDELAGPIARLHEKDLHCKRGCSDCCKDDLTVSPVEAEVIRAHYPELLKAGAPHAPGRCAFLEDGACRIYAHRPYVCRTQGLPMRWVEENDDGRIVEFRDVCSLNMTDGPPLEELEAGAFWTIGPVEVKLHDINEGFGMGDMRVSLREMFDSNRGARYS